MALEAGHAQLLRLHGGIDRRPPRDRVGERPRRVDGVDVPVEVEVRRREDARRWTIEEFGPGQAIELRSEGSLIDAELMDRQGNTWWEPADKLGLGYRSSNIPERGLFVLRARFRATYEATKEEIKHKTAEHLAERRRKQPLSKATAGSTFKQPEGGKPAGWYIDQVGLKGYRIGGAKVSEKHANWIENVDKAKSEDILVLLSEVKQKVAVSFRIELQNEYKYLK